MKTYNLIQRFPFNSLQALWSYLPQSVLSRKTVWQVGKCVHNFICMYQVRHQSEYTRFFRNAPQLEVLRHVALQKEQRSVLRISVLGCSTGAEIYSALWTIRSARPDLHVIPFGLDISDSAIQTAREGVYLSGSRELEEVSEELIAMVFETGPDSFRVLDWVREGISWKVEDARNPRLLETLGPQDIVVANNFLVHMPDAEAEDCLLNIAGLVVPGGHLFVWGVDLNIKTRVMSSLGMVPVSFNIENVYNADQTALRAWPWKWWGLEPMDVSRPDWEIRYCTVFQKPLSLDA